MIRKTTIFSVIFLFMFINIRVVGAADEGFFSRLFKKITKKEAKAPPKEIGPQGEKIMKPKITPKVPKKKKVVRGSAGGGGGSGARPPVLPALPPRSPQIPTRPPQTQVPPRPPQVPRPFATPQVTPVTRPPKLPANPAQFTIPRPPAVPKLPAVGGAPGVADTGPANRTLQEREELESGKGKMQEDRARGY